MRAPRIVVVGAGPAGIMAAREAIRRGAAVTLIDEAPRPGGQIYRQGDAALAASGIGLLKELKRKRALLEAFAEISDTVDYHPGATAYAVFPGPQLHVALADSSQVFEAAALILATGVGEKAVPFPGWTLPGVLYAGGAQAIMKAHGVRAGDRVAVVGAGPLIIAVAAQLAEAGAEIACVTLLTPLRVMARRPLGLWAGRDVVREGMAYLRRLRRAGAPVLEGWAPVRAEGASAVESLTVARHDGTGRALKGSERRFAVDMVAMNFGFTANSELARMAGAEVQSDLARGGWVPLRDEFGATAAPGVFVAGDGAGLRGAWVAAAEGRIVGAAAALTAQGKALWNLRRELAAEFTLRRRHQSFQDALRGTLELPPGVWSWAADDTVVCRCEGVTQGRLRRTVAEGHVTADAIKRNTRAGMGWCGGRTCLASVAALAAQGETSPAAKTPPMPPMRPRPPARPVTAGILARREP
jgi:NADPH-dependent 2,4-dienoyl-CoA reductase/sulfur reductase-like enzyme